jgi:hypothetical protein
MKTLNLPKFSFRYKEEAGKNYIFDEVRRKFVAFTPEEWVRQNFLCYMTSHLHYPQSLMGVERTLKINELTQRCDIVLYNRKGEAVLIVECKAPSVGIDDKTLAQAGRYNIALKVPYLVLTNGLRHYCIFTDPKTGKYSVMSEFPAFDQL